MGKPPYFPDQAVFMISAETCFSLLSFLQPWRIMSLYLKQNMSVLCIMGSRSTWVCSWRQLKISFILPSHCPLACGQYSFMKTARRTDGSYLFPNKGTAKKSSVNRLECKELHRERTSICGMNGDDFPVASSVVVVM